MPNWKKMVWEPIAPCESNLPHNEIDAHKRINQDIQKTELESASFTNELIKSSQDALDLLDAVNRRIASNGRKKT